jgi:hypothetical protein
MVLSATPFALRRRDLAATWRAWRAWLARRVDAATRRALACPRGAAVCIRRVVAVQRGGG